MLYARYASQNPLNEEEQLNGVSLGDQFDLNSEFKTEKNEIKVTGKIIYSVHFEYDMDEEMFKDPDCKDTGVANDWILDTAEEDVGLKYVDIQQIENNIRKNGPKDAVIDIIRDDVIVYDLVDNVKYVRDKYNIPSDGVCDR